MHSPPIHHPHGGICRYHAPLPLAVYELYALPNIVLQPLLLGWGILLAGLYPYSSGRYMQIISPLRNSPTHLYPLAICTHQHLALWKP